MGLPFEPSASYQIATTALLSSNCVVDPAHRRAAGLKGLGECLGGLPRGFASLCENLCRPRGDSAEFCTLPSTPPSAACWSRLFLASSTRFVAAYSTFATQSSFVNGLPRPRLGQEQGWPREFCAKECGKRRHSACRIPKEAVNGESMLRGQAPQFSDVPFQSMILESRHAFWFRSN